MKRFIIAILAISMATMGGVAQAQPATTPPSEMRAPNTSPTDPIGWAKQIIPRITYAGAHFEWGPSKVVLSKPPFYVVDMIFNMTNRQGVWTRQHQGLCVSSRSDGRIFLHDWEGLSRYENASKEEINQKYSAIMFEGMDTSLEYKSYPQGSEPYMVVKAFMAEQSKKVEREHEKSMENIEEIEIRYEGKLELARIENGIDLDPWFWTPNMPTPTAESIGKVFKSSGERDLTYLERLEYSKAQRKHPEWIVPKKFPLIMDDKGRIIHFTPFSDV